MQDEGKHLGGASVMIADDQTRAKIYMLLSLESFICERDETFGCDDYKFWTAVLEEQLAEIQFLRTEH